MRFQKEFLVIGALILCFGLVAGCGPHRFHRFRDRDFPKRLMKHWDKHVAELDLSEPQRERYEEIREEILASLEKAREDRESFFSDLRSEIDREDPDLERIVGLVKDKLQEMPRLVEENLDYFLEFYNILDDNQKAQVMEMIRERMKERRCL